jgi:F-type H+-transporting ATPase subunit gamma
VASTTEIQSRMKSIRDTMKITNAMYMISSSKLKRARVALDNAEPHFYFSQEVIGDIIAHMPNFEHRYFGNESDVQEKPQEKRRIGYIVVTGDKGLAGAYNHNIIKIVMDRVSGPEEDLLFVVGMVGRNYFLKHGVPVDTHFQYTAQNPTIHRARLISEKLLEMYLKYELDEVYIAYTRVVNSMTVEPVLMRILPLDKEHFASVRKNMPEHMPHNYETHDVSQITYLPTPKDALESIVPNYVTGFIYGALVESYAAEHNARMQAMESSTDNAQEMLRTLSIQYNSIRQAAITQEITEVAAGARAQKVNKT